MCTRGLTQVFVGQFGSLKVLNYHKYKQLCDFGIDIAFGHFYVFCLSPHLPVHSGLCISLFDLHLHMPKLCMLIKVALKENFASLGCAATVDDQKEVVYHNTSELLLKTLSITTQQTLF